MKKRILFLVALVMAIFVCSSCAITYNNLKNTTYAIYMNDEMTSGYKWNFTTEKWPYVGDTGYVLNIQVFATVDEDMEALWEALVQSGENVTIGYDTGTQSCSGVWKPLSSTEIYVNCPGSGHTKKTYKIEIDDNAETLTLTDVDGSVVMTMVSG